MNNELKKNIMKEIDNMITRESVINLTYWQEYQDPEDHDFFKIQNHLKTKLKSIAINIMLRMLVMLLDIVVLI